MICYLLNILICVPALSFDLSFYEAKSQHCVPKILLNFDFYGPHHKMSSSLVEA